MKNKLILILFLMLVLLIPSLYISIQKYNSLNNELKIAISNNKAYESEYDSINKKNSEFKLTISQLAYSKDSINNKLLSVVKEMNIKDKNLERLEYLESELSKRDTIVFRDTLFKDSTLNVDTIITDNWYKLKLGIKYPSTIIVEPKFRNECTVITSLKKETVYPPKKFFIARWFQKKHYVTEVIVVEKSPYAITKKQRFIEIIK